MPASHTSSVNDHAGHSRLHDLSLARVARGFGEAFRFLTWPRTGQDDARSAPGEETAFFPLVGFVLGLGLAVLDWLLNLAALSLSSRSVLDVVALVIVTRASHLVGAMDAIDGLLTGHTADERLMIMRDARVSAYAVVGCVVVLLLKIGLLDALSGIERSAALIMFPVFGRWGYVLAALAFPAARPDGRGAQLRAGVTRLRAIVAGLIALLIAIPAGGLIGVLAFAAVCAAVFLIGNIVTEFIPGLTPAIFGLFVETAELVALLFLALAR